MIKRSQVAALQCQCGSRLVYFVVLHDGTKRLVPNSVARALYARAMQMKDGEKIELAKKPGVDSAGPRKE